MPQRPAEAHGLLLPSCSYTAAGSSRLGAPGASVSIFPGTLHRCSCFACKRAGKANGAAAANGHSTVDKADVHVPQLEMSDHEALTEDLFKAKNDSADLVFGFPCEYPDVGDTTAAIQSAGVYFSELSHCPGNKSAQMYEDDVDVCL